MPANGFFVSGGGVASSSSLGVGGSELFTIWGASIGAASSPDHVLAASRPFNSS